MGVVNRIIMPEKKFIKSCLSCMKPYLAYVTCHVIFFITVVNEGNGR